MERHRLSLSISRSHPIQSEGSTEAGWGHEGRRRKRRGGCGQGLKSRCVISCHAEDDLRPYGLRLCTFHPVMEEGDMSVCHRHNNKSADTVTHQSWTWWIPPMWVKKRHSWLGNLNNKCIVLVLCCCSGGQIRCLCIFVLVAHLQWKDKSNISKFRQTTFAICMCFYWMLWSAKTVNVWFSLFFSLIISKKDSVSTTIQTYCAIFSWRELITWPRSSRERTFNMRKVFPWHFCNIPQYGSV